MRRLIRDFFAEQVGVDAKVPRSVRALVAKPGYLTEEYLGGRRARWVSPLKLYLSASVLYFLLLSLPFVGGMRSSVRFTETDRAGVDSAAAIDSIEGQSGQLDSSAASNALERRLEEGAGRLGAMTREEQVEHFRDAFTKWMPNAVFILLPLFAFLLYLLYRASGRFYAEHLIFTLHVHAFAFLALATTLILPDIISVVVQVWLLAYIYLALRRVYRESRGRTAAKYVGLVLPYMVLLLSVTFGVLLSIFATA
jgi:hypothetical protein